MAVTISGILPDSANKPLPGIDIILRSLETSKKVLNTVEGRCTTDAQGRYSIDVPPGFYSVVLGQYGQRPSPVGKIRVYEDSQPGDLNAFLGAPLTEISPEWFNKIEKEREAAQTAATEAKASEQASAGHVVAAQALAAKTAEHESNAKELIGLNTVEAAVKAEIDDCLLRAANDNDMEVRREQVRRITGASGMLHWGYSYHNGKNIFAINEGMHAYTDEPNRLFLGRKPDASSIGKSRTKHPELAIAGFATKLKSVSTASVNTPCEVAVKLPPAPDGTWSWNPNRTPAFINHMTYKDPKYGGTDAGGNRTEAVSRCFEQECPNGDFRNGLENWHAYGARGTATLNTKGVELVDTTGKNPEDASFYLQNNTLKAKANTPQRIEVVIESATDINAVRMRIGLYSNRTYKKLRLGRNVIEFTPDIDIDGANVCLIYVGNKESCVVGSMFVQPVSCEQVISPVDMWGFEGSLQEVTKENPFIYPNGLPQSTASTMDGAPTTKSNRPVEYYAWYTGDEDSKGDGVDFYAKSFLERDAHLNNPDNHLYYLRKADGTRGLFQWRVTGRSCRGLGNGDWYSIDSNIAHKDLTFGGAEGLVMPQGGRNTPMAVDYNNSFVSSGSWSNPKSEKGLFTAHGAVPAFNGECYFWLGGTASRLSESAYVEGLNESGSMACNATTTASSGLRWNAAGALTPLTVAECFNIVDASKDVTTRGAASNSGKIGTPASGRPDDRFCNAIYPGGLGGVVDRRMSAYAVDLVNYAEAWANIENGSYRGLEKLKYTKIVPMGKITSKGNYGGGVYYRFDEIPNTAEFLDGKKSYHQSVMYNATTGKVVYPVEASSSAIYLNNSALQGIASDPYTAGNIGDEFYYVWTADTDVSVSGKFLMRNVICDPANLPPPLIDGFYGEWLPKIPNNTPQTFSLTRTALGNSVTFEQTNNNGGSWTTGPISPFSENSFVSTLPKTACLVVHYTAWAKQTVESPRLDIVGGRHGVGGVSELSWWEADKWGHLLAESLIGKVVKDSGSIPTVLRLTNFTLNDGKLYTVHNNHEPIRLKAPTNGSGAAKALEYYAADKGRATIAIAANELKHNGTDWGDSGQMVIVDGTGTYTNDNSETCIATMHQLAIPLPYWANNEI